MRAMEAMFDPQPCRLRLARSPESITDLWVEWTFCSTQTRICQMCYRSACVILVNHVQLCSFCHGFCVLLQTCMLVGRWVLVEGVDSTPDSSLIEAAIACSRRWRKSGGTSPTSIGSVHPDFLLIMTCRSSHPVYPPEV